MPTVQFDDSCDHDAGSIASPPVARATLIADLRSRIRHIEGGAAINHPAPDPCHRWTLGVPAIDTLLGPDGFDHAGVHEIRCAALEPGMSAAAATASRRTFALLLAARRMLDPRRGERMLWCLPTFATHETGHGYARGLQALGLDPDRILIATPPKSDDVLWVIEEAVKAGCLSLVVGEVPAVDATAARRLSLAAAQARTACILVSPNGKSPVPVCATRWSIAPCVSGTDPLDPHAPGGRRFAVALERCRARPLVSGSHRYVVEWSDAARSFHMAAAVPDRAPAPERSDCEIATGSRTRRIA